MAGPAGDAGENRLAGFTGHGLPTRHVVIGLVNSMDTTMAFYATGLFPADLYDRPGSFIQTAEELEAARVRDEERIEAARQAAETAREAERRAYALLAEAIGAEAAAKVAAGGAYPIPSRLWPDVVYMVPMTGRVKVLQAGRLVTESCILADSYLPWPDQVLQRIKHIRLDETVVYGTGNLSDVAGPGLAPGSLDGAPGARFGALWRLGSRINAGRLRPRYGPDRCRFCGIAMPCTQHVP